MIRTPIVRGQPIRIEGDDGDSAVAALPDGAELVDDVLPVLDRLVADDAVVFDVGANVGLYTVALARLAASGHVYAFEPSPRTAAYLRRNVEANDAGNVTVTAEALGEEPGELEFFDNMEFSAGSMAVDDASPLFKEWLAEVRRQDGADAARGTFVRVPCTTLDAFVERSGIDRLDVLKVDTEGFDIHVLRGARRTLERLRPAVIVEFATFALTVHAQQLPAAALDEYRAAFERLFVLGRGGTLSEIVDRQDVLDLLYANATQRPVQDLLGIPAGCPLADRVDGIARDAITPPTVDDLEAARSRIAELEAELEGARHTARDAHDEVEAMRGTVSWRVTAPLRALRRRQLGDG